MEGLLWLLILECDKRGIIEQNQDASILQSLTCYYFHHLSITSVNFVSISGFCIHQWICPFMRSDDPIILQSPVSEHCFYYIYYMVKPSTQMPSGRILYTEMVTKGLETSFQNFSFQQKVLKYTSKCLQALGGGGGETGEWV